MVFFSFLPDFEQLLISSKGYLKLCDFGFCKKRDNSCTLCGTPAYISPEMIQGLTQSFGVDWWALGILIFEMIFGNTPFNNDPNGNIKMYQKILAMPVEFKSNCFKLKNNKVKNNGQVISSNCHSIIKSLLKKIQHQRLGSGPFGILDVKNHPWFAVK